MKTKENNEIWDMVSELGTILRMCHCWRQSEISQQLPAYPCFYLIQVYLFFPIFGHDGQQQPKAQILGYEIMDAFTTARQKFPPKKRKEKKKYWDGHKLAARVKIMA